MSSPAFDSTRITVVFVLGGPGAGKGTQCTKLVDVYNFCHLSAGDLLRAEQIREGSQYGDLIRENIRDGKIVPSYVTLKLLEFAMVAALKERANKSDGWNDAHGRFLIDGFPRKMDQAELFDETICQSSLVLFYDTTEDVLQKRLLERAKTSGREDDNLDSILKRFRTYKSETMPVIQHYQKLKRVAEINGSGTIDEVYKATAKVIENVLTRVNGVATRTP